jgi:hypothetical protein
VRSLSRDGQATGATYSRSASPGPVSPLCPTCAPVKRTALLAKRVALSQPSAAPDQLTPPRQRLPPGPNPVKVDFSALPDRSISLALRAASLAPLHAAGSLSATPRDHGRARGNNFPIPAAIAARHNPELDILGHGAPAIGLPHPADVPPHRCTVLAARGYAAVAHNSATE